MCGEFVAHFTEHRPAACSSQVDALTGVDVYADFLRSVKKDARDISIATIAGGTPSDGYPQANYVATKAGLIGLTKTMARELGRASIRVNAVAPGFIDTAMARAVPEANLASLCERTPLARLGKPDGN